jgi:predicted RNase H-like HicB family nuclease
MKSDPPIPPKLVRALVPYPAVFIPAPEGGWEGVFPNFSKSRVHGVNLDMARKAATEELGRQLGLYLKDDQTPPPPSAPEKLIADEEEPAGTHMEWVQPDTEALLTRLGLRKPRTRMSPSGQRFKP